MVKKEKTPFLIKFPVHFLLDAFVQNRLASFKDVVLLIPVAGFEKKEPIEGNPKVS